MTPRKKAIGVRAPDSETEPSAPHQGIDASDLSEDVERFLAEVGEAASAVVIWRMKDNKPGEWDYVTRVAASEYTNEYLKEQFGGGEYKLVVIDSTQGPLNPVFLSIDRRFQGRLFANVPAIAPTTNGSGDTFKDNLLQLLLARFLAPQPESNQLDLVLRVAEVFRRDGGGSAAEQANAMIQTAMTLAGVMNPPEGLAGVASQFLPVIDKIASQARGTVPPPRRLPATVPAPVPAPAPVTPNPPTNVTPQQPSARVAGTIVPAWLTPFKSVSGMLVRFADTESDPTVYADVALDHMTADEELFAAAVESMHAHRLLDELLALAPALGATEKRKGWATELVTRIEEGLHEIIHREENAANG